MVKALEGNLVGTGDLHGTLRCRRLVGDITGTGDLHGTLTVSRLVGDLEAESTLEGTLAVAGNITCGYLTSKTLKAMVYGQDGTRKENPDIILSEIATTGSCGLYVGLATNMVAGDLVVIYDNATSKPIFYGEYKPQVSITTAEQNLITIIGGGNTNPPINVYN